MIKKGKWFWLARDKEVNGNANEEHGVSTQKMVLRDGVWETKGMIRCYDLPMCVSGFRRITGIKLEKGNQVRCRLEIEVK